MWKAGEQLRQNIEALLAARHQRPSDLAFALKKHRSWMTRFLNRQRQELQLRDVDKIAAFFGLETYQLFAPGISPLTERRLSERRVSGERRIGHLNRAMLTAAGDINAHRPQRKGASAHVVVAASSPIMDAIHRETAAYERKITALLAQAGAGGQAPSARRALPPAPPRRGAAGGSHPEKP